MNQVDLVADSGEVGSATNHYGNGFSTIKTLYKTAKGSVADYDAMKGRSWVMENPNRQNPMSGGNVGYKLGE